jgi:hypothetical protein
MINLLPKPPRPFPRPFPVPNPKRRWGSNPCCVKCGSVNVYKMMDATMQKRNSRYL